MFSSNYDVDSAQKYKFVKDYAGFDRNFKKGDLVAEFTGHTFGQEREVREIKKVPDEIPIIAVTSADPIDQKGLTEYDCIPGNYLKKVRKFFKWYI
ncbi:hypothetical protein KFS98_003718 [Salmonella enterica]|nr:hypothetical protein [Salmonella enterica]